MPNPHAAKPSSQQSESAYTKWFETGEHCATSKANCQACPLYQAGMFHKYTGLADNKCSQPESNGKLLAQGILPKEERTAS